MNKKAGITIDVETDWGGRQSAACSFCQGIDEGLPVILDILKKNESKATFFISGELAEKQQSKLKAVVEQGHEVASHGYEHNLNYAIISEAEHLYQLEKSKEILETLFGKRVAGFRTPQFRFHPGLFGNLQKAGYHYDSSLVTTTLPGRYRCNNAYFKEAEKFGIKEIPVSTLPFWRIPFGLLWINLIGIKTAEYSLGYRWAKNSPLVMYAHPFDVISHKVDMEKVPWVLKRWYNVKVTSAAGNFGRILNLIKREYEVKTMSELGELLRQRSYIA